MNIKTYILLFRERASKVSKDYYDNSTIKMKGDERLG